MADNRIDPIQGFKPQAPDYIAGTAGLGGISQFAGTTGTTRTDGAGVVAQAPINFASVEGPSAENRAKYNVTGSQLDIGGSPT